MFAYSVYRGDEICVRVLGTAIISIGYRVEPLLRHGVESPGSLRNYNLQLFHTQN